MFWLNLAHASTFMPPEGTKLAEQYDTLYKFLLWASFIASALVMVGFIYFALKYKRTSEEQKTAYISHHTGLEFLWSFIPFVLFMIMFVWGAMLFHKMRTAPPGAFEVNAYAKQWSWQFLYKSGKTTTGEFVVPINKPIKMIMTSKDVIHSFYIPAFRIKQDVVPGRYTAAWFQPDKLGTFQIFCAEYCGEGHSAMLAKVKVVTQDEFDKWLQVDPDSEYKGMSLVDIGKAVYSKYTCVQCHSITAARKVGPGFGGMVGHSVEFEGGTSGIADENYIRESILNPKAKIVKGFPPAMPSFAGQLTELQISGVIEFLKSLKK